MKERFFLWIAAICCLSQVTALNHFKVLGIKPDLIFICVVAASLFFEFKQALVISVLAGLFKDIFGVIPFGINTLFFCVWCILIMLVDKEISIEDNYIFALLIFIAVLINDIVMWIVSFYLGNIISLGMFLRITILEALYTALVSPLIFRSAEPAINKF